MSELEFLSDQKGLVKPAREAEPGAEKAPGADPDAVLNSPAGPGQDKVRAKAVAQLQRSRGNRYVQRVVSRSEAEQDDVAQNVDSMRSGGKSLPDPFRDKMENAFGQDFSGVRVHDGPGADQASKQFGAKAFTTGQDIFFGQGHYNPGSDQGQQLMAHEMTHVVQQGNAPATLAGRKVEVSQPGDAGEREADHMAEVTLKSADVQRQEVPEEEEMIQAKADDVQRQELPEEEEVQAKADDVQRQQVPEEEEMVQAKADDVQRQEASKRKKWCRPRPTISSARRFPKRKR